MNQISFCIAQRNQGQQSRVLLLVQSIHHHTALNVAQFAKLHDKQANIGCTSTCTARRGFVVNTQPVKKVGKLVRSVIGLHGAIPRFQVDPILGNELGAREVPKILSFWNALLGKTGLQTGGAHD
ncbi:hypothetical protein [Pseudoalteromonas xiamenensis]